MSGALLTLRRVGVPCLIFAAAFLTFLPALSADFVNWDDFDNVVNNTGVHGLRTAQLQWMWTGTVLGHWIPLTWMSFGLNYALGGLNPRGYHLLNLLLHAASATVFFFIARRLLRAAGAAAAEPGLSVGAGFAALLFAVHPLRVESVVWVTERKDVLCGFFFMLAVLAYLRAAAEDATLRRGWTYASLAATAAALLSKAAAMPLPAVLLLLDVYPLGRARVLGWRRCLLEKLPWAAVAAIGGFIALRVVLTGTGVTGYETYGPGSRVAMTAYTFSFYPARWLWPVRLIPLYELPVDVRLLAPRFLIPALAFVAVTALLWALRRVFPAGLAAWALSVLILLPISGIVHAGNQLAHDRYSYLSGLGFAALAGGGLARLLDARSRGRVSAVIARSVLAGAAAVLFVLAVGAWDQSKVWQDSETLWRWSVNVEPDCSICWNNLGTSLTVRKRHAEAEAAFRRAFALRPRRATFANNIATALHGQNKDKEAEEMLHLALRLEPNLTGALANLGAVYLQQGKYAESLPYYRQAFAQDPGFKGLVPNYSQALVARAAEERRAGRALVAKALLQEALAVNPGDAEARRQLQALLAEPGRVDGGPAGPRPTR
ncbi:MAG: tetratricopeptide repeat protein [Candidatus Rokubacteria bacterium]|nr:tetratricopeptide repeat protein [Candidatus Rokubacteria bacterium]